MDIEHEHHPFHNGVHDMANKAHSLKLTHHPHHGYRPTESDVQRQPDSSRTMTPTNGPSSTLQHDGIEEWPEFHRQRRMYHPWTDEYMLQQLLEVVPEVDHDHALSLVKARGETSLDELVERLLSAEYPRQSVKIAAKETEKRNKKLAEDAARQKLIDPQGPVSTKERNIILDIFRHSFNKIPIGFIKKTQETKKYLYPTYLALNEAQHADSVPYGKTPWRPVRDIDFGRYKEARGGNNAQIDELEQQFQIAKQACDEINLQRRRDASRGRTEKKNLEQAEAAGQVADCIICCDSFPRNRMVYCDSGECHFTCFDCMRLYFESEVSQSRCKLICGGGCDGGFVDNQLRRVPDSAEIVDKLLRFRQEQDITAAGIDDVESCPFCDFKTVCPPVEIDFEFRCLDSDCNVVSCRKCREKSHVPYSCEEMATKRSKERGLDLRHKVEEDMSKALIRTCNKCKRPFIKEHGCNKMTCSNCGSYQCYICGASIAANYSHFAGNGGTGNCALHDNTLSLEDRHAQEVKAAQDAARADILRQNPDIDEEHLQIKMSDAVARDPPGRPSLANRPDLFGFGHAFNGGIGNIHPLPILANQAAGFDHQAVHNNFIQNFNANNGWIRDQIRDQHERLELLGRDRFDDLRRMHLMPHAGLAGIENIPAARDVAAIRPLLPPRVRGGEGHVPDIDRLANVPGQQVFVGGQRHRNRVPGAWPDGIAQHAMPNPPNLPQEVPPIPAIHRNNVPQIPQFRPAVLQHGIRNDVHYGQRPQRRPPV